MRLSYSYRAQSRARRRDPNCCHTPEQGDWGRYRPAPEQ